MVSSSEKIFKVNHTLLLIFMNGWLAWVWLFAEPNILMLLPFSQLMLLCWGAIFVLAVWIFIIPSIRYVKIETLICVNYFVYHVIEEV